MHKSHKLPFSENTMTSTRPLELLYSDVWSTNQKSVDGFRYYVIFIDHYTKYVWLYPMVKKSDVFTIFSQFKKLQIMSIFSDNGGEFQKLKSLLSSCGISHFTSPPHTPEHNGIAERRHRHITETGLSLLHHASMPIEYWSYAFQTAVYLINRLPTTILHNKTPLHVLFGVSPNYSKLKPFGCLCFPWLRPYNTTKIQPRSKPCVFLGYSSS